MTAFCLPAAHDHYLLAVLNSPLMWAVLSRITLHGKDEALRLKTDKMETIPIAEPSKSIRQSISKLVPQLEKQANLRLSAQKAMSDWLAHTFSIKPDTWRKADLTSLDVDVFIDRVSKELPSRRKLTASEISELKREYASTLKPAAKSRAVSFALEQKLSALVNKVYGLTDEDVQLMWRTAPPRMPFTPEGLTDAEETDNPAEHEETGE